jgi:hypothetical protein
MQHDVDIISDHEISIFNNNTSAGSSGMYINGTSETVVYNFETGTATSPYKEGYERLDIKTLEQGLTQILPNGEIFIEEQGAGRLLVMNAEGDVKWSYVNRAENGNVYLLHWSRYLQADELPALRQLALSGFGCSAEGE